ncbi:MAG: tetratricopeptide repeat protein [Bacteroidota bacterium]
MSESARLDLILKSVIGVVVAAIVLVGGYFGYTVYQDRITAEDATPALRLIKVLKQQVRKSPNDVVLRVRLGEALATAHKEQEAVAQLNEALKLQPDHTGALLDLGQLALIDRNPSVAESYFKKVVDVSGKSEYKEVNQRRESALYQLGRISLSKKDYPGAAGYFKEALRIRNDASDTYFYLAMTFDKMGERDEAEKQLRTALAFDPHFGQARYYLGTLLVQDGDKVAASYEFAEAVKADPKQPEPKQALAALGNSADLVAKANQQLKNDDLDGAYDSIQIAVNVDPENLNAVKLAAQIIRQKGDKKAALQGFKRVLELEPNDAEAKAAVKQLEAATKKKS